MKPSFAHATFQPVLSENLPFRTGNKPVRRMLATVFALLGGLFLVALWHRNYNLLGDFFDYSILTSAGGYLSVGLKPYRDFSTPLQSLPLYVGHVAEMIFGRRYLALAYGNLALGLLFYGVMLRWLKHRLPALLGILTAMALCAATFFQHGILWYNPMAMALLTLVVWVCALMYREEQLRTVNLISLCLLLYLSSMCKLNFHLLALGLTAFILPLTLLRVDWADRKKFIRLIPLLVFCGLVLGPLTEMALNGVSFAQFRENVLTTPTGRAKNIFGLLDPNLLLGKISDSYPDNWSAGIYLKAFLVYAGCLYLAARKVTGPASKNQNLLSALSLRFFAPLLLGGLFFCSLLLSVTNSETQMLTASFVVVGLVAVYLMFGLQMSAAQSTGFKLGIWILSGYFLVAGSASAFMHSRVRMGEPSWNGAMLQAVFKAKKLSALKTAVPFYDAAAISPRLTNYFGGVQFTEFSHTRLEKVIAFLDKNELNDHPEKVYWGPGLQIMNRVYNQAPAGGFPLWYHLKISVREADGPRIVAAMERNNYDWILASGWVNEMPSAVRAYIAANFNEIENDELTIYQRKKP